MSPVPGEPIAPVAVGPFAAEARTDGPILIVRMTGSAETPAAAELGRFVERVHAEVLRRGVPEVVVDLRDLEFMNSSCLKALVSWLAKLQDLESNRQYRIRFQSDPQKHWQRRSLNALACFAVDLVRVEG